MMMDAISAHLLWQIERGLRFQSVAAVAAERPKLVWVLDAPLDAAEDSLLAKMASAMKLRACDHVTLLTSQILTSPQQCNLLIILGVVAAAKLGLEQEPRMDLLSGISLSPNLGCNYLLTLHPKELLTNPQLKRQAWADLKKAMAHLGLT